MNWIKVENDAPAVLRALANGKKVRRERWESGEWSRLNERGELCMQHGKPCALSYFSGVWFIEPDRDIATDPQAGDEFVSGGIGCRVRFVHDGVVVWAEDGELYAEPLAKWTELWADEIYTRAK